MRDSWLLEDIYNEVKMALLDDSFAKENERYYYQRRAGQLEVVLEVIKNQLEYQLLSKDDE